MADKDKELAKQIIVEIIRQAGGTLENKTNLYKAFYYAHLIFAQSQPGYLSAWPIVKMPRGPGIDRFDMLLGELMAQGKVETKQVSTWLHKSFRFQLCEPLPPQDLLAGPAVAAIAEAVKCVQGKSAARVSREAQAMSRSYREAELGEELDIYTDPIPEAEYQRTKARIKEIAKAFSEWS